MWLLILAFVCELTAEFIIYIYSGFVQFDCYWFSAFKNRVPASIYQKNVHFQGSLWIEQYHIKYLTYSYLFCLEHKTINNYLNKRRATTEAQKNLHINNEYIAMDVKYLFLICCHSLQLLNLLCMYVCVSVFMSTSVGAILLTMSAAEVMCINLLVGAMI